MTDYLFASQITFLCPILHSHIGNRLYLVTQVGRKRYYIYNLDECTDTQITHLTNWYTSGACKNTPPNMYLYFNTGTTLPHIEITSNQIKTCTGESFVFMRKTGKKSQVLLTNRLKKRSYRKLDDGVQCNYIKQWDTPL